MCLLDNMYSRLGQIVTKNLWRSKKIRIDTKVTAFFIVPIFLFQAKVERLKSIYLSAIRDGRVGWHSFPQDVVALKKTAEYSPNIVAKKTVEYQPNIP